MRNAFYNLKIRLPSFARLTCSLRTTSFLTRPGVYISLISALTLGAGGVAYHYFHHPIEKKLTQNQTRLKQDLTDALIREKNLQGEVVTLKKQLQERERLYTLQHTKRGPLSRLWVYESANNQTIHASNSLAAYKNIHEYPEHTATQHINQGSAVAAISPAAGHIPNNNNHNSNSTIAPYAPRAHIDTHVRSGNQRTIAGTDVWIPLKWTGKNLVFADARFARDTHEALEGNFGLGIRQLIEEWGGIWGAYGYYDIRRSEQGNLFSQATLGTEWLAENWEARANAYIALTGEKTITNTLPTTIRFSGTGLIATGGTSTLTETPMSGFDFEAGYKLPLPVSWPDTRVYAGGYYFDADHVPAIHGARARFKSDITDWLQIGAEYRDDNIRDHETLAEIRLRYKFGESTQAPANPLLKRFEESPIRDVDIVTNGATINTTSDAIVTNSSSGSAQEIYFVDNTASAGGNGSNETPFNTLSAAVAVAGANDIIYVRAGDGTSTGMDSGITLNTQGQKLIGSGTNLTFRSLGLNVSGMNIPDDDYVIAAATTAPVITNSNATSDGITIAANDVYVSGITVSNSTRDGIRINAAGGQNFQNTHIENVTLENNDANGLSLITTAGGNITNTTLNNVTASNNLFEGVSLSSSGAGSLITGFTVEDSLFERNSRYGLYGLAQTSGDIGLITVTDTTSTRNGERGYYFSANAAGSVINNILFNDSVSSYNADIGFMAEALGSGGLIDTITLDNFSVLDNREHGVYITSNGTGSLVSTTNILHSNFSDNATYGLYSLATAGGDIGTIFADNSVFNNNDAMGTYILSNNTGSIVSAVRIENSDFNDNADQGLRIYTNPGQINDVTLTNLNVIDNGSTGVSIQTNSATDVFGTISLTGITASDNDDDGIFVFATAGAMNTITMRDLIVSNNGAIGIRSGSSGAAGVVTTLDIRDSSVTNNSTHGIQIDTGTASRVVNFNAINLDLDNNGENGLYLTSNGAGSLIDTSIIQNVTMENNAATGLYTYATAGGDFTTVSVSGSHGIDNGESGFYLYTDNANSIYNSITLSDSITSENSTYGFGIYANAGQITTLTLTDLTADNSGSYNYLLQSNAATGSIGTINGTRLTSQDAADQGLYLYATGGGNMGTVTLSDVIVERSGSVGVYMAANAAGSTITSLSLTNSTATDNASHGYQISGLTGGTITSATLDNLTATDNQEYGILLSSTTSGAASSNTVVLSNSLMQGNAAYGLYMNATSVSNLSAEIESSRMINNYSYGVFIDDDSTGTFTADLGGGALGSVGNNSIYGSLIENIRADMDNGTLKAENNWWGTASGLQATERFLDGTSTIDSSPNLTSAP